MGRFVVETEPVGATGPRDAGQRAARRAIAAIDPRAELGYDGERPVAKYPTNQSSIRPWRHGGLAAISDLRISIAHTRTTAVAVASRDVALLGIDIVATDDPRLARVADRLDLGEDHAAAFASIEARLKAHGHGILELLDGPPPELAVEICRIGNETIAVAYG